ncbi:LacI family DNA-binding transcriptional regulator [Albibacterium profundi]|uniref:LacI family DNA-binding transcriptional regulator n=1 Tax=Albibacterium profundi TaxID=3134906 RepID=A0ABV5C9X9_9SPHI
MEPINIKQLAEKLNLSTSTVSRAFRGNSDINPKTKERILAMAKELNYQPNHLASNLREKKSRTIAVIVPEIANNFFSRAINGIERIARENGYHILIYLTNDDFQKEIDFIMSLQSGRVDGIVMSVTGEANDHSYMHKIRKRSLPIVFFDRIYEDVDNSKITTNDYESSYQATKHLIEQGCKKVAYLVVNKLLSIGKKRMQGYVDALKDAGIPFQDELVIDCTNRMDENKTLLKDVFTKIKPDGVFASVERLALASYYVCHDLGIEIGADLKVISFSSLEIARLLNPALSTILQPSYLMGEEAAKLLFRRINSPENNDVNEAIELKSELIFRKSTLG